MEMIVIVALAAAYYYVFNYYRHCTIWILLSAICFQVSGSGLNESLLRIFSPLFVMLHYYALSVNCEQLELAAFTGVLFLAIVISPAFKNEIVLPESRSSPRPVKDEVKMVSEPSPVIETKESPRVEIVAPSQPQPFQSASPPAMSILKSVRPRKSESPDPLLSGKDEVSNRKSNSRRKSAGGVSGKDADVLDTVSSSNTDEAVIVSKATTKRRKSSGGRNGSDEDLLAQARAAARAELELAAQIAANNIFLPANRRGAKRRTPTTEVGDAEAMVVDDEEDTDADTVPSPKKLRTTRKRSTKMDL